MMRRIARSNSIIVISVVLISAILTQVLFSTFAASNLLTLSASKSSLRKGESVTVTLNASTDTEITLAHASVAYNPSKFQFISTDYSGSPLTSDSPESKTSNGSVTISRYKAGPPYPRGSLFVAQLTFKAIADSGSSIIDIDQEKSALYEASEGNNIIGGVTGTSITINNTTSGGGSTGTTGGSSGGGTTSSNNSTQTNPSPSQPSPAPTSNNNNTGGPGVTEADGLATQNDEEEAGPIVATTGSDPDLQAPGTVQFAGNQSFISKVASFMRSAAPAALVLGLITLVAYFGVKKLNQHPQGYTPSTSSHGTANTGPAGPGSGVLIGKDLQNRHK